MSVSRHLTSTNFRGKLSSGRKQEHSSTSSTKVLAEWNQAVVPVGAWVEVEQDFLENPSVSLACSGVYSVTRVFGAANTTLSKYKYLYISTVVFEVA